MPQAKHRANLLSILMPLSALRLLRTLSALSLLDSLHQRVLEPAAVAVERCANACSKPLQSS